MYDVSVFIGRFQPFHKGHLHNILEALQHSKFLVVNVGSSHSSSNIKNPFSYEFRKKLITLDLLSAGIDLSRVAVEPLSDYFYQEELWQESLRCNVLKHVAYDQSIAIVGHEKDESSYYLKSFPEWGFIPVTNYKNYNATDFREAYYCGNILDEYMCSNNRLNGSYQSLKDYMSKPNYYRLKQEYEIVNKHKELCYKDQVSHDVALFIIHKGKILLSKRLFHPGLGLWSLPMGNIIGAESVEDSLYRNFNSNNVIIENNESFAYTKLPTVIFDYESRSLLGRVISHVGVFVIASDLHVVNNSSNWLDSRLITETMCDRMYSDNYQIISILLDNYNISI